MRQQTAEVVEGFLRCGNVTTIGGLSLPRRNGDAENRRRMPLRRSALSQ
jgi:hypothetical protein